ncbi:MAG: acyltransferase family protein [Flavobacteriia bacterium]|jgi:peptidoglycan/LPS O-acetylase OafA/YrhL
MSDTKTLTKNDFLILDSLRGLAALYVMVAHSRGILWMGGQVFLEKNPMVNWSFYEYFIFSVSLTTRLAVEFVILFFVLSGFSIAYSLRKGGQNKLFYLKRLIRIYPPYLTALIWAGVVFVITKSINPNFYEIDFKTLAFDRYLQMNDFFNPITIFKNLIYLPMEGFLTPFWSLSFEVIFYIIAPFILIRRKVYYIVSLILFILGLAFEGMILNLELPYLLREFVFNYNFFFMLGVLLFWNYDKINSLFKELKKNYFILLIFFFLGLTYSINIFNKMESKFSFLTASIFTMLLIIYFLKYSVQIKFLQKIGKYSYTLYITHVATIFLLHSLYFKFLNINPPHIENFWLFVPGVLLSLLVAFCLYYICEKQTKNWIGKIREKT